MISTDKLLWPTGAINPFGPDVDGVIPALEVDFISNIECLLSWSILSACAAGEFDGLPAVQGTVFRAIESDDTRSTPLNVTTVIAIVISIAKS
jgi:hypothetical protein